MTETQVWQRIASASTVQEGEAVAARVGETPVAVCRVDGQIYVVDDICTHEFALLSGGFVEGDVIECPLHQAQFHIPTGRCLTPPAERDLRIYKVRIEGDDVLVGIASDSVG